MSCMFGARHVLVDGEHCVQGPPVLHSVGHREGEQLVLCFRRMQATATDDGISVLLCAQLAERTLQNRLVFFSRKPVREIWSSRGSIFCL